MSLRILFGRVAEILPIPISYLSKIFNGIDNIFGCRRIRFCNNFPGFPITILFWSRPCRDFRGNWTPYCAIVPLQDISLTGSCYRMQPLVNNP